MPRRREIPLSPLGQLHHNDESDGFASNSPLEQRGSVAPPHVAATYYQALMETPPHGVVRTSAEELLPLREVVQDALDHVLDERERWVFDAIVVERKSFRALAKELSLAKSYVHRMYHDACARVGRAIAHEPIIVEYLTRWDAA